MLYVLIWALKRSEIAVDFGNRTGVAAVGASELAKRLVPSWNEGMNLFYSICHLRDQFCDLCR